MEKNQVEFHVLGPTELLCPGVSGAGHLPPRRLALLTYLALETADGFRRRDQIIGLLWPDLSQEGARTQLRKALSALRDRLGPDVVVTRGEAEVRVDHEQLWCDAVEMNRHIRHGEWEAALSLYRGDLLEGFLAEGVEQEWEEWLADKRRLLRNDAARAAWECSRLEEERGDWKAAAVKARQALELAQDDEEGVRRLMSLLDHGGDRAAALRVYSEFRARLQAEYGVEPAPETRKLARKVQAARKGESHETSPLPEPAFPASSVQAFEPQQRPEVRAAQYRRPWRFVLAGGLLVVAGLGAGAILSESFESPPPTRGSLAVLPIRAIDTGVETSVLAASEELTTALVRAPGISVFPESRTHDAARCDGDAGCIGKRLHVAYFLDGGMQRNGDRLRITIRLIRTCDGAAVWAGTFDASLLDGHPPLQRIAAEATTEIRSAMLRPVTPTDASRCGRI